MKTDPRKTLYKLAYAWETSTNNNDRFSKALASVDWDYAIPEEGDYGCEEFSLYVPVDDWSRPSVYCVDKDDILGGYDAPLSTDDFRP